MLREIVSLVGLSLTTTVVFAQNEVCLQSMPYDKGKCVTYTGVCAGVVGNSVFVPDNETISNLQTIEGSAIDQMRLLRKNAGIVSPQCIKAGDNFLCSSYLHKCAHDVNGEAYPIIPCELECSIFWSACQKTANQYYSLILLPDGLTADNSSFPFCAAGQFSFPEAVRPPDVWGERIPSGSGAWPGGLAGVLRYPTSTYSYTSSIGHVTNNIQCFQPAVLPNTLEVDTECAYPLTRSHLDGSCKVPCPFPIFTPQEATKARLAFVVPGVISFMLCLFVFFDSCWIIWEATGGNFVRFLQRYGIMSGGGVGGSSSFKENSSAHDAPGSQLLMSRQGGGGNENAAAASGGGRKKTQLRASVLYALLGSSLGIAFFFIGPFGSLMRGAEISCPKKNSFFDMLGLINKDVVDRDLSNNLCIAQRVMPFILQAVFNLTLYAMVKVYVVVVNLRMEKAKAFYFELVLLAYCVGVPIACLVIHTQVDTLTADPNRIAVQLGRQTIICVGRYASSSQEIGLIFIPYIFTGVLIIGLSIFIFRHLQVVKMQVSGLQSNPKSKSGSSTALNLLLLRLAILGISTFVVLIVLMASTGTVLNALTAYGLAFFDWFSCSTAGRACANCASLKVAMDSSLPTGAVIGVQLFCMSSICLLFSVFFAAQSASRLYKEYNDGSLIQKIDAVWYGRDNFASVNTFMSGKVDSGGNDKKFGSVLPGQSRVDHVAAYMSGGDLNPIVIREAAANN